MERKKIAVRRCCLGAEWDRVFAPVETEGPVGSSLEFGKDQLGRFFPLQNPKKSR